ncbi:hypothetical protein D7I41_04275 [Ochrobactrum sp. MH181795]|nr:hypothetical protein D7I41_04275 [Ochrobactrum sp. MH181795]
MSSADIVIALVWPQAHFKCLVIVAEFAAADAICSRSSAFEGFFLGTAGASQPPSTASCPYLEI